MPSRTTTRATTGCYCGCGCRCRTAAPSPLATRPAPCAVASAKAAFRYSRHSRAGQPGPPAPPASARKQLVLKSPARLFAIEGLSDDHFRCVSSVALRSREGPFTEPRAGAQPRPRERVLMPRSCRSGIDPSALGRPSWRRAILMGQRATASAYERPFSN